MQIIKDRRALHEIPELDRALPRTEDYLRRSLEGLGCRVFSPMPGAVCAFFDFGRRGTVAFRSDADALPVTEKTGLPFASRHPGCMHACGHDGHMAMLLELARRLDGGERPYKNVLLVFQPGEETTGGAKDLCETGIFREYGVEAIFGMHLWPGLAPGTAASRKGEMMSRSCEVTVEVTGRSAHIARAAEGKDALAAAVAFYDRAAEAEKRLPFPDFRLLRFGVLEGGTARNAVAGSARLCGTLRAFRDEVFFALREALAEAAGAVERETGCAVRLTMNEGYPPVRNGEALYDRARQWADFQDLPEPTLITEDFSWYQRAMPGLFFFLGVGDTPPLHAADFDFDETILLKGADFLEKLARNYR